MNVQLVLNYTPSFHMPSCYKLIKKLYDMLVLNHYEVGLLK